MTILFLLNSLQTGGSEQKSVRIVNALHTRGVDIHLGWLSPPHTLQAQLDAGVPAIFLDRRGRFSLLAARRLTEYAAANGIQRIVCMNLYPVLYCATARWLSHASKPSCLAAINSTNLTTRKEHLQMHLYAPLLRRAGRIIFGCNAQRDQWIVRYRLPAERCQVIYNGVDSQFFSPDAPLPPKGITRTGLGFEGSDFVIGSVGALRPEKAFGDIIHAVDQLRAQGIPAKGLIAGKGSEEAELKAMAADAGVSEHIRFTGELADVRPALAALDVFVLPSTTETFSNAALEAMSMGKPVLLSDTGGAREMVKKGIDGLLFPAGDRAHLSSMLAALSADSAVCRRIGMEARQAVIDRFSIASMAQNYLLACEAT